MKKVLICLLVLCLAVVVGCSASPAAEVPATPVPDLNTETVAPASEIEQETEEMDVQEDESNKEPVEIEVTNREYSATYIVLEDGTACIMKLTPEQDYSKAEFTIPTMLDHHIVSTIYDFAIGDTDKYSFSYIYIPDSVVFFVGNPFQRTYYHISVSENHPTLAVIDDVLYDKVSKALIYYPRYKTDTTFIVPEGILEIGDRAFWGAKFTEIQLPSTLKVIGYRAFCYSNISSINIPDSVESIGNQALYINVNNNDYTEDQYKLKNVTMSDSTALIGNPFDYHDSFTLKVVKNKEKQPAVSYDNGILIDLTKNRIVGCYNKNISSYTVPNGIISIDDYAFTKCENLKSISIPNSVTNIGEGTFALCSSLKSITIPNSVTNVVSYAFYGCDSLKNVTIPDSVTNVGNYAFYGCSSLENVTIPDSVTNVGEYAFSKCNSLSTVVLLGSITAINSHTFSECTMLESIIIPEGVEEICDSAFENCENLKSVSIPNGVTIIGEYAFSNCNLQEIVIPYGVKKIGGRAFNGKGLETVTLPKTLNSIGKFAFRNMKEINFIVAKDSYAHTYVIENEGKVTFASNSNMDWLNSDVTITPPPLEDRTPGKINTPVPTSTPEPTPYVSFTNKYGTRTTICHHSGCNDYIATSGDTNCCPKHSRRCLECGAYIDEDATYCLSCIKKAIENAKK